MTDQHLDESGDRVIIELDPKGLIELNELTGSFAALARFYERHYRPEGATPAPKLFVSRMETGSIIAEIVPLAVIVGAVIYTMDSGIIVADFTRRLWRGIKAFSASASDIPPAERPSRDDARDLQDFVRPLTGKNGAALGIKHARLAMRDGSRTTVAEYIFDETELNRAAINMERTLELPETPTVKERQTLFTEVMLFFEQASRAPGKAQGRTGDKGVVPAVTDKPLPVYFRKGADDLKDQMVRGEENPITSTYVVDVYVQYVGDEPKGYIVTNIHKIIPTDDDASS